MSQEDKTKQLWRMFLVYHRDSKKKSVKLLDKLIDVLP